VPVAAFLLGLTLFIADGKLMAMMVRALLDSGERRGRGFILVLGGARLFLIAGNLYVALIPLHLSAPWLVGGALTGLAVFCVLLVTDPKPNFSLFSGGKLR
jgi:hypothetical protein